MHLEYINEIIRRIADDVKGIDPNNHLLHLFYRVSPSKLTKDFKRSRGITLREWIIRKKLELAKKLKSDDIRLTVKEVVSDIGWTLSERAFNDSYKKLYSSTFGGREVTKRTANRPKEPTGIWDVGHHFVFSRERELLDEIVLRMVLLTGEHKIERDRYGMRVTYDAENTCLSFPFLMFQKQFVFEIIKVGNGSGGIIIDMFFTRYGSDHYHAPNHVGPYLDLIVHAAKHQSEHMKDCLLATISNWDELVDIQNRYSIGDYRVNEYRQGVFPKINRQSKFFDISEAMFQSVIASLTKRRKRKPK